MFSGESRRGETESRSSTGGPDQRLNIRVCLVWRLAKKKKNTKKTFKNRRGRAHADVLFCIIVIIFNIFLRLFCASEALKLARFRVPHTFDLDLELSHLDSEEFLWTREELVGQVRQVSCMSPRANRSGTHQNTSLLRSQRVPLLTDLVVLQQCYHS